MQNIDNSISSPLFEARCIYCKKGSTKENPMLFKVHAPGEYYQHWSFENKGCKENMSNINPMGETNENNRD